MPNAITGTMLFDWSGDRITSGYEVIQPKAINEGYNAESSISIDLDKSTANIGDIIKAEINVKDIDNLAGYQLNLQYDPEVIQLVDSEGKEYTEQTFPDAGKLLSDDDYGLVTLISHQFDKGIVNFSKFYTNLEEYKSSVEIESSGDIAVLFFKVISNKSTSIEFTNTPKMPNGISGTLLFDYDGNKISGYVYIIPLLLMLPLHQNQQLLGSHTNTPEPTTTRDSTNIYSTPTSTVTPVITGDGYITIDLTK